MFKKILIAVDVSDEADTQRLLAAAKNLTATWEAELHAVTVIPTVGMAIVGSYFDEAQMGESQKAASAQLDAAIKEAGIDAKGHVALGKVYDDLIATANKLKADLILIGAHQPELKDYLLGPNAARVVRHSNQSVLVLRD